MNELIHKLLEMAKEQGLDISSFARLDGAEHEINPVGFSNFLSENCDHLDTSGQVCFDSEGIMFEDLRVVDVAENGEAAKYESTRAVTAVAEKVLENYTFHERASKLNIPPARHASYESIEKDGSKPLYVTWEMPSGFSRRLHEESIRKPKAAPKKGLRNRWWPKEVIWDFAEQVRARRPVGYMGHADIFTFGQVPENIPVQWESAIKATRKSDGTPVTLVRGYVYNNGMNREYIKTGAIDSASVFTVGTNEVDTTDKGDKDNPVIHVKSAGLISFDFVRKGTHGIPGTQMVANLSTKEDAAMTLAELIAALTEHKFDKEMLKKYFPEIYAEVAGADVTADYHKLAKDYREAVSENVALTRSAEIATHAASALGCEVADLPKQVSTLKEQVAKVVEHTITATCAKIKHEGLRKAVIKDLQREGITDAADVEQKFAERMEAYRDLGLEIADEYKVGAVEGERMSNSDDDMLSETASELDELDDLE